MTSDPINLTLHHKQGLAYKSEARETLACSGIQGGKTTIGSLWSLKQSSLWLGDEHAAIIGAPTYKILQQSTLPTFLKWAQGAGIYSGQRQEFRFHTGLMVYIRTSTDAESVEGIQNVRWAWLDEAGKCKRAFYINVQGRCARTAAPMFLTTTPYAMNWPHSEIIVPCKDGTRKDVAYFEWLSIDNPSFPREEYERQRQLLDPRTFRRKYMGIHERMEGLVYELTGNNRIQSFDLPRGTRFFASVDWGHSEGHEFALLVRACTLDGFRYTVDEFKAVGLDPNQQVKVCQSKKALWGIELFGCDPSRPDMISLLNKSGCKGIGFHEGNENHKQVIAGITLHTALVRSNKYAVFEDKCPKLLDEYETYHWPEFKEESPTKELPVKIDDDLMDCERMMTVLTQNIFIKEAPEPFMTAKRPHVDLWNPTKRSKKNKSWDSF